MDDALTVKFVVSAVNFVEAFNSSILYYEVRTLKFRLPK